LQTTLKKMRMRRFSNESLGPHVEIASFFRYDEPRYLDEIEQLKKIGYCKNKPASLRQIGFTPNAIKKYRERIEAELLSAGIHKLTYMVKDNGREIIPCM